MFYFILFYFIYLFIIFFTVLEIKVIDFHIINSKNTLENTADHLCSLENSRGGSKGVSEYVSYP